MGSEKDEPHEDEKDEKEDKKETDTTSKDGREAKSEDGGEKDDFWSDDEEANQPKIHIVIKNPDEVVGEQAVKKEDLFEATKSLQPLPSSRSRRLGTAHPASPALGIDKPATPNPPRSPINFNEPKANKPTHVESTLNAFSELEKGNFSSALQHIEKAIKAIGNECTAQPEKQKKYKICSHYKAAFTIFLELQKKELLQTSTSPSPSNPPSLDFFHLFVFLANLGNLRPEHRIVAIRRVINESIKIENFGLASQYIELLLPLKLMDHAELEKKNGELQEKSVAQQKSPTKNSDKLSRQAHNSDILFSEIGSD